MPALTQVLTEEDLARRSAPQRQDLSAYLRLLDQIRAQQGLGGVVTLDEGEHQRTEKRRLSLAAKQQGYGLTWRRAAAPRQLRFVLAEAGQPTPGGRQRRPRTAPQMAALAGEGALTAETDTLVETTANGAAAPKPEPAPPPATGRRRRQQA